MNFEKFKKEFDDKVASMSDEELKKSLGDAGIKFESPGPKFHVACHCRKPA